jgi:hypothetical protein
MELEEIRACLERGSFSVTDHALTEGFKDGITVADMMRAVQTGKNIDRYPERHRCLILGQTVNGIPIHVVVDFRSRHTVDIITTYIPQKDQWIKSQIRKRKKR